MKFNWTKYSEDRQSIQKPSRKFILLEGDDAVINLNPGPDEPKLIQRHWVNTPAGNRPVPCVQDDPRFPGGCYPCLNINNPTPSFAWNVIDTRWLHLVDGPKNKKITKICAKNGGTTGTCEHCNKNNKPFFAGGCLWETSVTLSQQIMKVADDIAKTCVCGEELRITDWSCSVCGSSYGGALSSLVEEEMCPSCGVFTRINRAYSCANEEKHEVAPRAIEDVYLRVSRTGSTTYNITPLDRKIKAEHLAIEPLDILKALVPLSVASYAQQLQLTTEEVLLLNAPGSGSSSNSSEKESSIDAEFEEDSISEANPFK